MYIRTVPIAFPCLSQASPYTQRLDGARFDEECTGYDLDGVEIRAGRYLKGDYVKHNDNDGHVETALELPQVLSLSLSLSHTHTHTHSHTLSLSRSRALSLSLSLSLSRSRTVFRTLSRTVFHTLG